MEAVWKRILILLLVGVLLTILAFPIVRGQDPSLEEEENDPEKISTRIKGVYFGPVDSSDPFDGRPDFYEDQPEDWVFTYLVLEGSTEETSGAPAYYGIVWLNITMGPYTNSTRSMTDIRGRVHFNFTSRFADTETGNVFTIPSGEDQHNLTLMVYYQGNDSYHPSWKTRNCTYHRERGGCGGHSVPEHPLCCLVYGSFYSIPIIFVFIVIYFSARSLKRKFQDYEN